MDRQFQSATFRTLDDQVGLAAVRCTQGLGRSSQRGGHRVHVECAEIGEHVERRGRRIRPPTIPLAVGGLVEFAKRLHH
jgi:hypothetical protein